MEGDTDDTTNHVRRFNPPCRVHRFLDVTFFIRVPGQLEIFEHFFWGFSKICFAFSVLFSANEPEIQKSLAIRCGTCGPTRSFTATTGEKLCFHRLGDMLVHFRMSRMSFFVALLSLLVTVCSRSITGVFI